MSTVDVSLYADDIVFWKEGPQASVADFDAAFAKVAELTEDIRNYYLLVDLTSGVRPGSELRERLRQGFGAQVQKLVHVAVYTGNNAVMNISARFVFANLGLRSFSVHENREEALRSITALSDPERTKEEIAELVVGYLLELNDRRCSITDEQLMAEKDARLREIMAAVLCLHETMYPGGHRPPAVCDDFYESAPDMFSTVALPSGRILHCNSRLAHVVGRARSDLVGASLLELHHPESRTAVREAMQALVHNGILRNVEVEMESSAGQRMTALISGCAIRDQGNNVIAAQLVAREITGWQATPLEVHVEEVDREQVQQEVEELMCLASHDLQEPLRLVATYAELLQQEYKRRLDKRGGEYLKYVIDGVGNMRQMVGGLMNYAKVQHDIKPLRPISADEALDRSLANLKAVLEESGACLRRADLPTVLADESQLVQLFQNLIDNAIKYRGKEASLEISISARRSQGEWVFAISDNGIGIPREQQERVFEVFGRLHAEDYPGAGLGLPIAKRVVERHGGRIWVESDPGHGATFYFTLPAVQKSARETHSEDSVLTLHPADVSSAANALRRLKADISGRNAGPLNSSPAQ